MKTIKMRLVLLILLIFVVQNALGCGRRRRRPRPRPPVNRAPSISCPSIPNVVAPPLATTVRVVWNSPSVSDDKDSGLSPQLISGRGPGSHFGQGKHTVAYKVTDRGGLSNTCSRTFYVTVISCPTLNTPRHGTKTCNRGDNIYGTTCRFTCNDGYRMEGKSISKCQRSKRYDASSPKCIPKECRYLETPRNGIRYQCTFGFKYNSLCSLVCDSQRGYTPQAGAVTRCLANQEWDKRGLRCEDTRAPVFKNCPSSVINSYKKIVKWPKIKAEDNSGFVTVTQTQGSPSGTVLKPGKFLIRYDATDPSGNKASPCVFVIEVKELSCSRPSYGDDDLSFKCSGYKEGSQCSVSCESGTLVKGAKFILCKANDEVKPTATWVPANSGVEDPMCPKRPCPALSEPANGALVCDTFLAGTFCHVQCNKNFDIPLDATGREGYMCGLESKKWFPSETPPDCNEIFYPDEFRLPNVEHYYFVGDCEDTDTIRKIQENFLKALKNSIIWSQLCSDKQCKAENVKVSCGEEEEPNYDYYDVPLARRRRALGDADRGVSSTIQPSSSTDTPPVISSGLPPQGKPGRLKINMNFILANPNRTLTLNEAKSTLRSLSTDAGQVLFNMNLTSGFLTDYGGSNGTYGNVTVLCAEGTVRANSSEGICVGCPAGTFFSRNRVCLACPINTYQDREGSLECKRCPRRTVTLTNGTKTSSGCRAVCPRGQFSASGVTPCSPCPPGTYQSGENSRTCDRCPAGTTTEKEGSIYKSNCLPYDVMAEGDVSIAVGQVISEYDDELTIALWIRLDTNHTDFMIRREVEPRDFMIRREVEPTERSINPRVSLNFTDAKRGHQMTVVLSSMLSIMMIDQTIAVRTPLEREKWIHLALIWKGYPRRLDIYKNGKRVVHFNNPTPLCMLPEGTKLTIDVSDKTAIMMRELFVIPSVDTDNFISKMAKTCVVRESTIASVMDRLVPSDPTKVRMLTPSLCSEIDRCTPDPCNGHLCQSHKYGYECVCHGGYTGDNCTQPPNFCAAEPCKNNASCVSNRFNYTCLCMDGYRGKNCETVIVNGNWSGWSAWTSCSLTCGGGVRTRQRKCDSPVPDPDGRPCVGTANDSERCNTDRCPECRLSQLTPGHGVRTQCNGTVAALNCSITCKVGLVFAENPSIYICRDEVWKPSPRTIACVEPKVPKTVGFKYAVNYNTTFTKNVDKVVDIIRKTVERASGNVTCSRREVCTYDIDIQVCSQGNSTCDQGEKGFLATIDFSADTNADTRRTALESLAAVNRIWKIMNDTYKELKENHDELFSFTYGGKEIRPGDSYVDPVLSCPAGAVTKDMVCVACAPGTVEEDNDCHLCDAGFYSNQTGKTECDACPGAHDTEFLGSVKLSDCIAPPADSFMLMTDPIKGTVWQVNMTTFNMERLPLLPRIRAGVSGYDPIQDRIFFADRTTPAIHSVSRLGSASKIHANLNWVAAVGGMAVDPVSHLVFYTDKGNDVIGVVTTDTGYRKTIIREKSCMPRTIVADPFNGTIYWTDWGREPKIEASNYDGSNRRTLANKDVKWPEGLVLDRTAGKLYWCDAGKEQIEVMNLDGTNRKMVLHTPGRYPSTLTLFADYLFYTDLNLTHSYVMRVNTDGTGNTRSSLPSLDYISDIHSHRLSNYKNAKNRCSTKNGGCSHICFPAPNNQRVCACPNNYALQSDGVSCLKKKTGSWFWDVWMRSS